MVENPHSIPSPESIVELHTAQMRDFIARMIQQKQTAMEAMLNSERGRPAAQAQGVNEKYSKRVESLGEQAWRDRPRRPAKQRTT